MTEKESLKKIKCNLTGKTYSFYESYYNKKIVQYGSEDNLVKYYVQNKIISLIKSGHNIADIAKLFKFDINENNLNYYDELIKFHKGSSNKEFIKESKTHQMETDEDVKEFINKWLLTTK